LIRFRVRNFRSLKTEQEFSMAAASSQEASRTIREYGGPGPAVHRVAAIYGANGSGKTNVLRALDYMKTAVRNSQKLWPPEGPIPRDPFLLDSQSSNDPSFFEAELALGDGHLRYGFTLNNQEVLEERLDAYPGGKRQVLLRREGQDFAFGNELVGDNQAAKRLTRPNSLFLSAAATAKHPMLLPVYRTFAKQITYVPWNRRTVRQKMAEACQNESLRPLIERLLREADPAIASLSVRREDLLSPLFKHEDPQTRALLGELIGPLQKLFSAAREEDPGAADFFEKQPVLSLHHKSSGEADVALDQAQESDGTLAYLGLLVPVLQAIRTEGTVCIDEIEAGIHPLLALRVVRLFSNSKLAGRGAQIIFTTLDTNLLNAASLQRDQIWFTEKDPDGRTHLYPLTNFTPERNDKLQHGYLQGLYGRVPFLGWANFIAKLDANTER
jgi:uncharacterized protein